MNKKCITFTHMRNFDTNKHTYKIPTQHEAELGLILKYFMVGQNHQLNLQLKN